MTARELQERFVQQWGALADLWGLNPALARIHALLYVTGAAMTADEIMQRLSMSRGNVSMNIRAALSWGLVRRHYLPGDRKQYFVAEGDPWTWFKRIIQERKRREADPIIQVISDCKTEAAALDPADPDEAAVRERLDRLNEFMIVFTNAVDLFLEMDPPTLKELLTALSSPSRP